MLRESGAKTHQAPLTWVQAADAVPPCPPTGKSATTDCVYVVQFEGDRIRHLTKIWHSGLARKELGWV